MSTKQALSQGMLKGSAVMHCDTERQVDTDHRYSCDTVHAGRWRVTNTRTLGSRRFYAQCM